MTFVMLLLFFVAPFTGYTFQRNYALGNMLHIALAVIFAALIILWIRKLKYKNSRVLNCINSNRNFKLIVFIGTAILLLLELLVDFGGCFIVGFDTRNVVYPDLQMNSDYMSMYPNQLFLAGIFRRIYNLCQRFGIVGFIDYYMILVIISTILVALTVLMIAFIARKLMGNLGGICTFICAAVFLGLDPYFMIPYSDTFAMFCVTSVLFFYIVIKNPYIKWFAIVFISIVGAAIKPTVIFVGLSIAFVEICKCFKKRSIKKRSVINTVICAILIAVSVFASLKTINFVCDYGVKVEEERSFSSTHFLMMGINEETRGAWNGNDVTFSRSFKNVEDREEANIEKWGERLQKLGPGGIAWIFLNKTMTNFGDGSFAWEAEVPWNIQNIGENKLVWFIYGIDPWYLHNDKNNYFSYPMQCIWMGILIGCVLTWFGKRPRGEELVLCCSVLCIGAFLMLFEPDPRYLYLYTPCLIILGVWGWKRAACVVKPDELLVRAWNKIIRKNKRTKVLQ